MGMNEGPVHSAVPVAILSFTHPAFAQSNDTILKGAFIPSAVPLGSLGHKVDTSTMD